MPALDTSTRSLEVVLAGAEATSPLPVTASWGDRDLARLAHRSFGSLALSTAGATAVTAVPAPPSDAVRRLRVLTVQNADTAAATVTVRLNDNGTTYTLCKVTLSVGDRLRYEDGQPVQVLTSAGKLK